MATAKRRRIEGKQTSQRLPPDRLAFPLALPFDLWSSCLSYVSPCWPAGWFCVPGHSTDITGRRRDDQVVVEDVAHLFMASRILKRLVAPD